jgi:hypothetical protein
MVPSIKVRTTSISDFVSHFTLWVALMHPRNFPCGKNCQFNFLSANRKSAANAAADPSGTRFIDFFQRDKDGQPKGMIALDLKDLP